MLAEFLKSFCDELTIETPRLNEQKIYSLEIGGRVLALQDLDPGIGLQAVICEIPKKKKEDLVIYLMRANLLTQGTGGARIGLSQEGNFLTLSLGLPYELNYQIFRDTLEDFVNYLIYWEDEVKQFEKEDIL
jgi:hypothetical protein